MRDFLLMRFLKKYGLFLLIIFSLSSLGQNIPFENGGKNNGVGNSSIAIAQIWSINNNQAGLAYLKNPEIAIYYTNRFLLKELSSQSIAYAYPSSFGTWGIAMDYFGYTQHSEFQIGLAYAKRFNDYISIGARFNYLQYQQTAEYGNTHTILAELGILSHPNDKIFIGAHIYNPSMSKFDTNVPESAPTIMSVGLAYLIDDATELLFQIDKNIRQQTTFKIGTELKIKKILFLRAGINILPHAFFLGIGYNYKNIRFNIAFSYQQILGISPSSSFSYQFSSVK